MSQTGRRKRNRRYGKWGRFLLKWGMTAVILAMLFLFVIQIVPYHGLVMYPSVRDGDLLVIYRRCDLRIGDIVRYEDPDGVIRLGRIAATEGQTVDITESGEWTRNGSFPTDNEFYPTYSSADAALSYPHTVEEGAFFILNDYRADTDDSRLFGSVPGERILGIVVFVFRIRGI